MVFDILSFLAGIAAGAVTGALAGVLHSLENTADLQEKLRHITKEVERMKRTITSNTSAVSEHKSPRRLMSYTGTSMRYMRKSGACTREES